MKEAFRTMKRLDDSILEALAELICGSGVGAGGGYRTPGPYRTMGQICKFFEAAGVQPQGESSTRKWFVLESLQAINGTEALERVLLRLTSPKEYKGDPEYTGAVIAGLNRVLQIEGLEITLVDWQPTLQEKVASAQPAESSERPFEEAPQFERLVPDGALAQILSSRWDEAEKCVGAGAYLSAVVMMGSVLEGVLLHRAEQDPRTAGRAKCSPKDRTGKVKPLREWGLTALIDVAQEVGWLQGDVHAFSHALRDYRNLVHPHKQRQDGACPDENTCLICWQVVKAAIDDLMGAD